MDKRIALQLFGQLRFWPEQKTIIPFVDKLRDAGYLVDIYGTFWNDEYTMNLNTHGKLDIFSKLNLIEEPDNAEPFTLEKYYYCLSQSNLYRSKEGIDYDLIIAMRPDLNIKVTKDINNFENIFNILEQVNNKPVIFHVNDKIQRPEDWVDDKIIIANPVGIDKLNNIYSDYDISKDVEWGNKSLYFRYHNSLCLHIAKLDILQIDSSEWEMPIVLNLIRHALLMEMKFDDGFFYKKSKSDLKEFWARDIAKTFQDYNSLVSWVDEMKIQLKKNLI
jgi:hypothetical protein|tara:strand:+ start:1052 stop:1879 length:828 start_codon:yes stop_codon:yes gene_type:complete